MCFTSWSFSRSLYYCFLVWREEDERYCRDYDQFPRLTSSIVSQLTFIERQRGHLDILDDPHFHVSFLSKNRFKNKLFLTDK